MTFLKNRFIAMILILVGILFSSSYAQVSRTSAMGGLSYSIIDRDEYFNPYLMGGNPAWLVEGRMDQYLEITPEQRNFWGDYRRIYTPEHTTGYTAGFAAVKPLGSAGTFKGRAVYDYEIRRKNFRTLKKDTYAGESFFFTDTTSGDVVFNGPLFEFSHGIEIMNDFFLGASVEYQIADGLKKIYTFGETIYRDVSGKLGAAYRAGDALAFAADYEISDSQERIEANDVNLLTVRAFHHRGDTYAIELRGSSVDYKISKYRKNFGGQIYFTPNEKIEIGAAGYYYQSVAKTLFPRSGLIDDEDGYSSFNGFSVDLRGRYLVSNQWTAGMKFRYDLDKNWSKNSKRDLLLWQIEMKSALVGCGTSFELIQDNLLLGAEYEAHFNSGDSLKYIDHRSINISSADHYFRVGAEYLFSSIITLRTGFNLILKEHDFFSGGEDITAQVYTAGFSLKYFDAFTIDGFADYADLTPGSAGNTYYSGFRWGIALRFYQF